VDTVTETVEGERCRWPGRRLLAVASALATLAAGLIGAPAAPAALSLTTTAAPTFSLTLNGSNRFPTYLLPMTVNTDQTGGWHLTVTSTRFTTGGGTPRTLPANASSITATAGTCVPICNPPINSVVVPVAVPAGATPPAAVKFFNAAANSGTGETTVTTTVTVTVPANTYAGVYTSTLTLNAVSGP
jgi:hypothetical protein